jgi:hypothetical protein
VIFIDFFSGGGRSNGLDCSERSNLLSKKYVSLVLFARVQIFKPRQCEHIKVLPTNHELQILPIEKSKMEMVTRKVGNMKKYKQQDCCYKLLSQLIKKFTAFYEI